MTVDQQLSQSSAVTVSVSDLTFSIKVRSLSQRAVPCFFAKDRIQTITGDTVTDRLILLKQINIIARPSCINAILGPSGCGKSTLLNVIANRAQGRVEEGTIMFNGLMNSDRQAATLFSVCYAEDRMFPYLTVYETLNFQAILRMGKISRSDRKERVDHVLRQMALSHVKDTLVGGTFNRGLSTGEQRRLAIACELITNPPVLLLDEPTTGLDAVLAYEVMHVLRRLARQGRTIICTIHQPRSSTFELLDRVTLLAQGRCLYSGKAKEAAPYFVTNFGYRYDSSFNPAEFLIDIASENVEKKQSKEAAPAKWISNKLGDAFYHSTKARNMELAIISSQHSSPLGESPVSRRNSFSQWWVELGVLTWRSILNIFRDPITFMLILIIQGLVGAFFGYFFYDMPGRYLPERIPPEIGDPEAPAMMFLKNPIMEFFTSGIDGAGTNPLFDMIIGGVDGKGSEPIEEFRQTSLARKLVKMPTCSWRGLEIVKMPEYSRGDFVEYLQYWDSPNVSNKASMPDLVGNAIQTVQLMDYVLADIEWKKMGAFASNQAATRGRPFYPWFVCVGKTSEILTSSGACSGVFPNPPNATNSLVVLGSCTGLRQSWRQQFPPGVSRSDTSSRSFLHNTRGLLTPGTLASDNAIPLEWEDLEQPLGSPIETFQVKGGGETQRHLAERDQAEPERHSGPERHTLGLVNDESKSAGRRKLQASVFISGNTANLLSFLPIEAQKAIQKIGQYGEALTKCEHEFCRRLAAYNDVTSEQPRMGDYMSVFSCIANLLGGLFFAIANAGFTCYYVLVALPQERPIVNREMANKVYKPSTLFISRSVATLLSQFPPVALMVTLFFFLVGFESGPNAIKFGHYLGLCLMICLVAFSYSCVLGALCSNPYLALTIAPPFFVVLVCCSGFFVRDSAIPSWMGWLKGISFYRFGLFSQILAQFPPDESFHGVPNTFSLIASGIDEFLYDRFVIMMAVQAVVAYTLAFFVMKYLHRDQGLA